MGKWNKLTKANIERHNDYALGFSMFSKNWAPICEMFGSEVHKHPWIVSSTNKNLSIKILTPHHIISISSLNYIIDNYKKILTLCKYNVNHPKNLLLIPNKPSLACELEVPYHTGNHAEWETVDNIIPPENIKKIRIENDTIAKGYHFYVNSKVRKEIKKFIKKCKNYKIQQIVDAMDDLSKTINNDITHGQVKLNKSGAAYLKGGNGCGLKKCVTKRNHNFYIQSKLVKNLGMTSERLKTAYEIYG